MSIAKELAMQTEYLRGERIESVYFGGGTPSILTEEELGLLFETIHTNFSVSDGAEITLEANPDDLDREKLAALRRSPINRLSIGIQSFNDDILRFLNRSHNAAQAFRAFHDARENEFTNLSIDLIYGIPSKDEMAWKETLRQAFLLLPEHLSCYGLTIESKTYFGHQMARKKFKPLDEESELNQFESLLETAGANGYAHYEISNFARPSFRAVHNSNYWNQTIYLGVGPGAHSYNGTSRQQNVRNNPVYIRALDSGRIPFTMEILSLEDHINEYVMTSLRTIEGCAMDVLQDRFGYNLLEANGPYIQKLVDLGFAHLAGKSLQLSSRGKFIADKITSELFVLGETTQDLFKN